MTSPTKPIIYVTRDIERALGMEPTGNYHIVTNKDAYSEQVATTFPDNVHLINSDKPLTTQELISHPKAEKILSTGNIVVFKNTPQIETLVKEKGWTLLNPSADLAEKVENKITQIEWLGILARDYLPPHRTKIAKEITWTDKPFVLQWAHGHTGESTILVRSHKELEAIQKNFPERIARVSDFVRGPSFTVNALVAENATLLGNINYQITGAAPFTDNEFTTIGNDWALAYSLLSESEITFVETMAEKIGDKLRADDWKGLFGIDFMRDDELDRLYLIEINARQPAGSVFESTLQKENRNQGVAGLTIFEAHLLALSGNQITESLIPINDGAQIVQRVTKSTPHISDLTVEALHSAGYTVIHYPNNIHNADLLRIQSIRGIMETHGKLNTRGKEILSILTL